jgi:ABC transport system ATP-binding/permease protein
MNLFNVKNISKIRGDKKLFSDTTFGLQSGEKMGIIGVNGSGKSTLLGMIQGMEEPDTGEITKNRELKISSLRQSPEFSKDDSVKDHIFKSDSKIIKLIKDYEIICEKYEKDEIAHEKEFNQLHSEMDRLNGWDYESKIRSILLELGLEDLSKKMGEFSGGTLKKIELVKALIEESNLLILDEPTNHLDVETILWLENFLIETDKALILITHDRYFLDRVVDTILEIDSEKVQIYKGNYNYYLQRKVELQLVREKEEDKRRSFLRRELEWLGRQPKARSTKQKARTDRAENTIQIGFRKEEEKLELSVIGKRQGKMILEINNLSKSFGNQKIIDNFTYFFKKNEKLGIVGRNGIGKSTLLNLLSGRIEADSGFIKPGVNTSIGYFDQVGKNLVGEMRVLDYIRKNVAEYITMEDGSKISASQMLERFLFTGGLQALQVNKLSGGEKRRLYLVEILMKNPNFLILDEPTNDLDIKTLSILEEFVMDFPGTVIVVSHDRYFMDRVTETLVVFRGKGVIETYVGTYSSFLDVNSKVKNEKTQNKPISVIEEKEKNPPKLSNKEKKELDNIESEISKLEAQKTTLTEKISNNSNYQEISQLTKDLEVIEGNIQKKIERWEYLSSK